MKTETAQPEIVYATVLGRTMRCEVFGNAMRFKAVESDSPILDKAMQSMMDDKIIVQKTKTRATCAHEFDAPDLPCHYCGKTISEIKGQKL